MINMIKCPSFAKCALFQFSCGAGFLLAASLFLSPHFLLLLLLFYLFDRLMFALREEITATAAIRPNIDASEISVCVCVCFYFACLSQIRDQFQLISAIPECRLSYFSSQALVETKEKCLHNFRPISAFYHNRYLFRDFIINNYREQTRKKNIQQQLQRPNNIKSNCLCAVIIGVVVRL